MDTLVRWKKKRDLYRQEADEDEPTVLRPRLVDGMQCCKFVCRDEANAAAMKKMGVKW